MIFYVIKIDNFRVTFAIFRLNELRCVARQLTIDHNPGHPAEAARMQAIGAPILQDSESEGSTLRVDGVLAVTRAFGNNSMKQWIKAEPEVMRHEVGLLDDFLIIASDGLWDTVTNENAVSPPCCDDAIGFVIKTKLNMFGIL